MGGRGMIDLKQCKFGDKLRTRDGRMAVFLNELAANIEIYVCVIKNDEYNLTEMMYRANGKSYYHDESSEFDITCRWAEIPIVDILLRGSSLIIKNNEGTINIS